MLNTITLWKSRPLSPLRTLGLGLPLAFVLAAPASAATHRIYVPHGHGTVYVHGYLRGFQSRADFVLHARHGQRLGLLITHGGATVVSLTGPHGFADGAPGGVEDVLPRTGDYHIKITEHRMGEPWRGRFTLRVRLQ